MVAFSERQLRVCRCSCQRRPWGVLVCGFLVLRRSAHTLHAPAVAAVPTFPSQPTPRENGEGQGHQGEAHRREGRQGRQHLQGRRAPPRPPRRREAHQGRMVSVLLCWRMAGGAGPVCAACVRVCRVRIANTHTPSAPVYDEVRGMLKTFLKSIMADTVCVCELTKRRTVSAGPAKQSVRVCVSAVPVSPMMCDASRVRLIVCWSFPGRRRAVRPEEGGQDPLRRRMMRPRYPLPSTRRSPVSAWGSADCRCIRCSSVVVSALGVSRPRDCQSASGLGRRVSPRLAQLP